MALAAARDRDGTPDEDAGLAFVAEGILALLALTRKR